jgi:hypothetical protein
MRQGEKKMIFLYWISSLIVNALDLGIFTEMDTTGDLDNRRENKLNPFMSIKMLDVGSEFFRTPNFSINTGLDSAAVGESSSSIYQQPTNGLLLVHQI